MQQLIGTVKWYHQKKGFGFIMRDDGGEDVFLHHSALDRRDQSRLEEGSRVRFGVEQRHKGPSALDVTITGEVIDLPDEKEEETSAEAPAAFDELGLHADIMQALGDCGYTHPTPIQAAAVPPALTGRDVLGCAQTGTGKTASFALPTLHRLADGKRGGIRALAVAPTRELAIQIEESFRTYGRHTGLRSFAVYGGVSQKPQEKAIRRGVDILVATPGRLLDLMGQGIISLNKVEILILDEADRMLDMGFLPDIKRIRRAVPNNRQTLFFSATVPDEIRSLVDDLLRNPVEIFISPEQPTVEAIEQAVYYVSGKKKQNLLEHLLNDDAMSRVLVFTRTKRGANRVVRNLGKVNIQAEPIHGNKSQGARQRALRNFRKGKTRVLVATDVAARGIDVDDITHVIQYDLPNEPETYVHRIGRTGRAGAEGVALAFCSQGKERHYLRDIERLTGEKIASAGGHPFA